MNDLNRMNQIIKSKSLLACILLVCVFAGCSRESINIQRFGQLMLIDSHEIEYFEGLQKAIPSEVIDELSKASIHNYSLFIKDLGDSLISIFCYFEYTGNDFHSEMSLLQKNPVIRNWERNFEDLSLKDILPGGENNQWKNMDEVFNFKGSYYTRVDVDMQSYGMVIGLRPEYIDSYTLLHKHAWAEVLDAIEEGNIRNYSIYLQEIKGNYYLFSYFEYIGANFDSDMAMIDSDTATIAWMKFTDKVCQLPIPTREEGEWWAMMKEILYSTD